MPSREDIDFSLLGRSDFDALAPEQQTILVDLVRDAAPEYYALLPVNPEQLRSLLSAQVAVQFTELENVYIARAFGNIIGMASMIEASRIQVCQLSASKHVMRLLNPDLRASFQRTLKIHADSVEPHANASGIYLPRLAICYAARGKGFAKQIMDRIMKNNRGSAISLHVEAHNEPVIKLYRSLGFEFCTNLPYRFRIMSNQP